jgi:hypothetical protein
MAAISFTDVANPTEAEIRRWAATPRVRYPMEDWDIIISCRSEFDRLFIELAGDEGCPHQETFLHILYLLVGDAVRSNWNTRSEADIRKLLALGADHPNPSIQRWAARASSLAENPATFDYKQWCDRGFARDNSGA